MAERKSFLLRIDAALYDDIRRLASAQLRSVNGQIEFILRRAVERHRSSRGEGDGGAKGDDTDRDPSR